MAGTIFSRKRIAYFIGADNAEGGVPTAGTRRTYSGNSDLAQLGMTDLLTYSPLVMTANYFRQKQRHDLRPFSCLVNLVTDPDLNPKVLANLERLMKGWRGPIVNHPGKILRTGREKVARRLAGIEGLIVPPTVRLRSDKPAVVLKAIADAGIRFPAIVRVAGSHSGRIIGVFDRAEDIPSQLEPKAEHFVISFVDFRSADGLYRKHRVFFFGDRAVVRHFLIDESWNIHGQSRSTFMADRPETLAEEKRLIASGLPEKAQATLMAVRDAMDLDFFGIDFAMTADQDLILFEANSTMNFFPFVDDERFDYVKGCLKPSEEAFQKMLDDKLASAPPPSKTTARQRSRPGFRPGKAPV